ncbi:MAG TPA: methyltransferase domain-containing protein [Bryobacteraceae bacterium]
MPPKRTWDAELYEAHHSFVWQLAEGLLTVLDPKPGERILSLGCGPGHLAYKIAERGAQVVGLDSSPEMIGSARQNYPQLSFVLEDAARMRFDREFDAVFSNAALHWMLDASGVARAVARSLRMGGRFVAEMGGKGNIRHIESAVERAARRYSGPNLPEPRTFFPSLGEYAGLLEESGLEVRFARLFDRPTELEGANGMEVWVRQFKGYYFEGLPRAKREEAIREVIEELRPILFREGKWTADYRRLQIVAVKSADSESGKG